MSDFFVHSLNSHFLDGCRELPDADGVKAPSSGTPSLGRGRCDSQGEPDSDGDSRPQVCGSPEEALHPASEQELRAWAEKSELCEEGHRGYFQARVQGCESGTSAGPSWPVVRRGWHCCGCLVSCAKCQGLLGR